MTCTSTVSAKGRITIPKEIRIRLGLKKGDRVEFVTESETTIIRPARHSENPFRAYAGILGTFRGGEKEINASVSELRDEELRRK